MDLPVNLHRDVIITTNNLFEDFPLQNDLAFGKPCTYIDREGGLIFLKNRQRLREIV